MFSNNFRYACVFVLLIAINISAKKFPKITDSINIDVCNAKYEGPHLTYYKENSIIQVNVLNVNLLKYNVVINQTSYSYDSSIPNQISDKLPILGIISNEVPEKRSLITPSNIELIKNFYQKYNDFKNAYNVLTSIDTELSSTKLLKENTLNSFTSSIKTGFNIEFKYPNLSDLRSSLINKYRSAIMSAGKLYKEAIKSDTDIDSNAIKDVQIAKAELDNFNLNSIDNLAKSIFSLYISLKNMDTITTKIIHCSEESDEMLIRIVLVDKSNDSLITPIAEYPILIHRQFHSIFSIGLGASLLHDNSYNLIDTFFNKHQIVDGKDTSELVHGKIVKENNDQKYPFSCGLSVLYNALWYPCNTFGMGLFIGSMLTIPDLTRTQYVMGGTFAYGKKYKMCLNIGISAGNIRIISDKTMLSKPFLSDISEIPLKDNLEFSPFGSISVSIGKKVKKEDN